MPTKLNNFTFIETENTDFEEITEHDLGIDTFAPVADIRTSCEELKRIKRYSDENLKIIFSKISTLSNDEEKRNIIVNLIGALDYYIHEIVIWGLIQITLNKFPEGKKYDKVKISISYLKNVLEQEDSDIFNNPELKRVIIEDIRKETYQKWNKIREGLKIILPDYIENKIANLTGNPAIFQSTDLEKISDKRHLIVHHFDREYHNDSERNLFTFDCLECYELIKLIINSIHQIIKDYEESQPEKTN